MQGKTKTAKAQTSDVFTVLCKTYLGVECVKEYRFHPRRKWRFDYAIPAHKIAIEVEGGVWTRGRHTRPKGFLGDMDKYNAAAVMGWRLLRCTPKKQYTQKTLDLVKLALSYKDTQIQ